MQAVIGCNGIEFSEQIHECISMKLWVFSVFLILTRTPTSEQCTSRFSRKTPYLSLVQYSNMQFE